MTLPKKGLRKLEYKGANYGWMIRAKPTYSQGAFQTPMTVAIESLDSDTPQVLHVMLNISRPDNWIEPHETQVTPQKIREMIDKAHGSGWEEDAGGKPFEIEFHVVKHT